MDIVLIGMGAIFFFIGRDMMLDGKRLGLAGDVRTGRFIQRLGAGLFGLGLIVTLLSARA